jgi:hypothetical protein
MNDLDSPRGEFESTEVAAGEFRLARGILRWFVAVLNVAGIYAFVAFHEPKHICGFAALMLVTVVCFDGALTLTLRLHAALTELAAILGGLALLIRGAWTNELLFLKLAALVFFGLLTVTTVIEGVLWVLTEGIPWVLTYEPPAPVDHFPRRFEVTVPTDAAAAEESRRLIEEEFRESEARR